MENEPMQCQCKGGMCNDGMCGCECHKKWRKRHGCGHGGCQGVLWFVGWLFTIGFLKLAFWKGVLALVVWPYYLGVFFR